MRTKPNSPLLLIVCVLLIISCKKAAAPATLGLLQNTWRIKSESVYNADTKELFSSSIPSGNIVFGPDSIEIRNGDVGRLSTSSNNPDSCTYSLINNDSTVLEIFNRTVPFQFIYSDTFHINYISTELLVISFDGPQPAGGQPFSVFTIDSLIK